MNKYLESIQSLDSAGTSVQGQALPDSTPVLEMSGEAPSLTYIEPPRYCFIFRSTESDCAEI